MKYKECNVFIQNLFILIIVTFASTHIYAASEVKILTTEDVEGLKRYYSEPLVSMTAEKLKYLSELAKTDPVAHKKWMVDYKERLTERSNHQRQSVFLTKGKLNIKDEDLIGLIDVMLSTDSARTYIDAFNIIKGIDQVRRREGERNNHYPQSICINPDIINKMLPLLNYSLPTDDDANQKESRHYISTEDVRNVAIRCLINSDFNKNPELHKQLIETYKTEESIDNKRTLLLALTEVRREETEPLLIDAIRTSDIETSNYAATQLSFWQNPPASLLPWLVERYKGDSNILDGWTRLLRSYGARATDYLPELITYHKAQQASKRGSTRSTVPVYDLHELSFVAELGYDLTTYSKENVLGSHTVSEETLNFHGLLYSDFISNIQNKDGNTFLSENPLYSNDRKTINQLGSHYELPEDIKANVSAISSAEYQYSYYDAKPENSSIGIDVFVTNTDDASDVLSKFLVSQKQARRIVTKGSKIVYVIWSDAVMLSMLSPIHIEIHHYFHKEKKLTIVNGKIWGKGFSMLSEH